jgi:ATP-dependent Clp protease ATP-binding subunit ClpB
MSEYMEKHAVSRLYGAPPGYVGYEEGGQLTEAVRRRPYSVVLLDEIEKAHPDVFNVLLQIMEDGRMTDGQGRTVDFRNTILVMTSNVGSDWILSEADGGFGEGASEAGATAFSTEANLPRSGEGSGVATPSSIDLDALGPANPPSSSHERMREKVMEAVRSTFKPEFLNRVDDIVVFHRLSREEIGQIVEIQVGHLAQRLAKRNLTLEVTEAARAWLADKGYDPSFGARPLRRLVQKDLADGIAMALLRGDYHEGDRIEVDLVGGELFFRRV